MISQSILRANAMKAANILASLDVDFKTKWSRSTITHNGKDFCHPPSFSMWPEIDMDTLLPIYSDREVLVDDGLEPVVWPIDCAFAFDLDGGIRLAMAKTVKMSELRGLSRRISKYNAICHVIDIDRYGSVSGWGGGYYGKFGKDWVCLTLGGNYASGATGDRFHHGMSLTIGGLLRHRYEWSAVFQFPSGIKLRFGCSASAALELFHDRDKPENGRRTALLHWVRKHWRKTSNPDVARSVRKHLRGVTMFEWRGMSVSVIPAEYEIEKAYAE